MKSKVLENKKRKLDQLLDSAFELFSSEDIQNVSISDIVKQAGIAKGTFYLYFKDKYDLQKALIKRESRRVFEEAHQIYLENDIRDFEDGVIFLINQVLIILENNSIILRFIHKSLSWGVFDSELKDVLRDDSFNLVELFKQDIEKSGYHFDNPEITLFIILDMVGSACYSSIMDDYPLPFNEFKPYLLNAVRSILHEGAPK
ncbi:MAG: TetR/AcrR family transcriptional regulator [Faecalicoccus sp.]|nr:TetR/AcrR family transcriptional regulator [Faecalicoccus sp.]